MKNFRMFTLELIPSRKNPISGINHNSKCTNFVHTYSLCDIDSMIVRHEGDSRLLRNR